MIQFRNRKLIRFKGYNYASPGYYFITICTYHKQNILGDIVEGCPTLSMAGQIVLDYLNLLSHFFENVSIDTSIAMPNHLHFIIRLHENNKFNLTQIIRNLKSVTARKIKTVTKITEVWQRSFYDRIIRTERELNLVRLYVDLNPVMWEDNKKLADIDFKSEDELAKLLEKYRDL
jgi:putative transposase